MCGLVGYITLDTKGYKAVAENKKIFKQLLYTDALRGEHGTGIFSAKEKEARVHKAALPASTFLDLKRTEKYLTDTDDYPIQVGHNRYATQGAHTYENTHPFQHTKLSLVHNGTVNIPGKSFDTDSETICNALSKCETKEEEIEYIKKLNGAYVLIYYNIETETLTMVRNSKRTFNLAYIENTGGDLRSIFFASEELMLDMVLDRNITVGYTSKDLDICCHTTIQLKDNKIIIEETPFKEEPIYIAPARTDDSYYNSTRYQGASTTSAANITTINKDNNQIFRKGDKIIVEMDDCLDNMSGNGTVYTLEKSMLDKDVIFMYAEPPNKDMSDLVYFCEVLYVVSSVSYKKKKVIVNLNIEDLYCKNKGLYKTYLTDYYNLEEEMAENYEPILDHFNQDINDDSSLPSIVTAESSRKEKALQNGCQVCSANLDSGNVSWFDSDTAICDSCSEEAINA